MNKWTSYNFCQLHAVSHTHKRVGIGNLVLRHSVLHLSELWRHCMLIDGTQRRAFVCLDTRTKKMKILNISLLSSRNRTINLFRLVTRLCPCALRPQLHIINGLKHIFELHKFLLFETSIFIKAMGGNIRLSIYLYLKIIYQH